MLTPWLWVALAWAGPEEAVAKLVETGDFEKAQKRCEDVEVTDEVVLREVCAKAYLPAAQQQNTVAAWQAYLARWSGTSLEAEAREAEASAALYAVGHGGKEADYAALLAQYPDSVVAAALTDRMGAAAIRDAFDGDEAVRVARKYPNHELLPGLVERYLGFRPRHDRGDRAGDHRRPARRRLAGRDHLVVGPARDRRLDPPLGRGGGGAPGEPRAAGGLRGRGP